MSEAALLLYVVAGLLTAGATFAFGKRWRDDAQPASHPAAVSALGGLLWPLLVVGALQYGAIALVTSVLRDRRAMAWQ